MIRRQSFWACSIYVTFKRFSSTLVGNTCAFPGGYPHIRQWLMLYLEPKSKDCSRVLVGHPTTGDDFSCNCGCSACLKIRPCILKTIKYCAVKIIPLFHVAEIKISQEFLLALQIIAIAVSICLWKPAKTNKITFSLYPTLNYTYITVISEGACASHKLKLFSKAV